MKKISSVLIAIIIVITIQSCKKETITLVGKSEGSTSDNTNFKRALAMFKTAGTYGERTEDAKNPCKAKAQSMCKFGTDMVVSSPEEFQATILLTTRATLQIQFDASVLNNALGKEMFNFLTNTFFLPSDAQLVDAKGSYFRLDQTVLIKRGTYFFVVEETGTVTVSDVAYTVQ